jgi:THO complex subunit 4
MSTAWATKHPLTSTLSFSLLICLPRGLMSEQTKAGSARLSAYHGAKRQLIGTSASQVAPAWRTSNATGSPAVTNGSTSPLSKKAFQRGSKILLSNLPVDVAETEVEVGT